jgi:hypothetical protein
MSLTINEQVSVREIAIAIANDWKNISPYAKDYLEAMKNIDSINDNFYADSAVSVVSYFLANASTYRGENAKAYKDLLKKMLKQAK